MAAQYGTAMMVLAGALAAMVPARAEAPGAATEAGMAALSAYVNEAGHRQAVLAEALRSHRKAPGHCAEASLAPVGTVAVFEPPVADAQGRLHQGGWRERFEAKGCGTTRLLNVLVLLPGDEPVRHIALLPGDSKADPLLQRDSLRAVMPQAGVALAGCGQLIAVDTRFDGYQGDAIAGTPNPQARAWGEVWTIAGCDRQVGVPIRFTPDATGTGFAVRATEIAPVP